MRHININGRIYKDTVAAVPFDNRAFRFGFGLFETMLMKEGVIQFKEYHFDRLFSGLKKLKFVMPDLMDRKWLESEVLRTVKKNKLEKLCRIRLQVYAGRGGLYDGQNQWSEFVIEAIPINAQLLQLNEHGLNVGIAEGLQKSPDSIANFKSTNALIYALAAKQAKENNWDDALVCNTYGNILECSYANVFWIKGETVFTPPLSEGCVAGVMRRHLLQDLPVKGVNVEEKPFTLKDAEEADGVFVTNAIRRFKWVSRINDFEYPIDKILPLYEKISF